LDFLSDKKSGCLSKVKILWRIIRKAGMPKGCAAIELLKSKIKRYPIDLPSPQPGQKVSPEL
jgi:hypothetical protein